MVFLAKKVSVSERLFYFYVAGKRCCSLKDLVKIANLRKVPNFLDAVYANSSLISTWGHRHSKLPKEFTFELAYLTGFICGGGHISKRSTIKLVNDSKKIIQEVVPGFVSKVFDCNLNFYKEGNCYIAELDSKPINLFFKNVIGIPAGKKKGRLRVPEFIFLSAEFKVAFLKGLFDDDGGLTLSKKMGCECSL